MSNTLLGPGNNGGSSKVSHRWQLHELCFHHPFEPPAEKHQRIVRCRNSLFRCAAKGTASEIHHTIYVSGVH